MTLHIFAYNQASGGARNLAQALGIRRIKAENSQYRGSPDKTVINWGASQLPPNVAASNVLNRPAFVALNSNKLRFFQCMSNFDDVPLPEWTDSYHTAMDWLHGGSDVCARYSLSGHSGEGLTIFTADQYRATPYNVLDAPRAPLYTKYIKKKAEYRVHFAMSQIIDIQRKIRDPNRDVVDWRVRNHANGFIFARNGVEEAMPQSIITAAEAVIRATNLDFGAIDLIYNSQSGSYVLEINTAPGLEGQTVTSYAEAFRQFA